MAYYDFMSGNGQTVVDRGAYHLDGELGSTSGSDSEDPTWIPGGGLDFTPGDYVRLPQDPRLQFEDVPFTVVVVLETDSATAATLISRGGNSTATPRGGWRLAHNAFGTNGWHALTTGGATAYVRNVNATFSTGTRYVYGFSGTYKTSAATSAVSLYRNGVAVNGTEAGTATAGGRGGFVPIIGGSSYGTNSATVVANFDGKIYFVALWNRELTADEHRQIWTVVK